MLDIERLLAIYLSQMCLRRIRARYGENGANDVPAGPAFANWHDLVKQPASRIAAVTNSARNSGYTTPKQPYEFGKGSPHQKTVSPGVTAQMKGVGVLA